MVINMSNILANFNPTLLIILCTLFTWFSTALGAATIFLFKDISKKLQSGFLGFAAGVMIAATVWSLLIPAMELAEDMGQSPILPAVGGFATGAMLIWGLDKVMPHMHQDGQVEGPPTNMRKSMLMVLAIVLHNIPEGLAVGIAFGGAMNSGTSLAGAAVLAIGIGLQNIPEGAAVSFTMQRELQSKWKSFNYGQLSGIVEPISAVVGILLAQQSVVLMPWLYSFAGGAMMFVVVEELIPESQVQAGAGENHVATFSALAGFLLMMTMDVTLG